MNDRTPKPSWTTEILGREHPPGPGYPRQQASVFLPESDTSPNVRP